MYWAFLLLFSRALSFVFMMRLVIPSMKSRKVTKSLVSKHKKTAHYPLCGLFFGLDSHNYILSTVSIPSVSKPVFSVFCVNAASFRRL